MSVSRVAEDSRVRRHADALAEAGYDVCAVGLPGTGAPPEHWSIVEMPETAAGPLYRLIRATSVFSGRFSGQAAHVAFWSSRVSRALYRAARPVAADVYIANDWLTLPVAARLAEENGGRFFYDSHEYAVEEASDRVSWRLLFPPYIRRVERKWVGRAATVITVSDGIADLLQSDYCLSRRPVVVRNVPPFDEQPFRPCRETVTVLYHGAFRADRNLENLIRSTALWQPRFRLVVRGFGEATMVQRLRSLAAKAGSRVEIEPRCPAEEVIAAANRADIGIHPIAPDTAQTRFCLPNKFFEYAMAGLALAVTDAAEMATLVRRYGLGAVMDAPSPDGIAATINAFTPAAIDQYKRQSLEAARVLNWDQEKNRLLDVIASPAKPSSVAVA